MIPFHYLILITLTLFLLNSLIGMPYLIHHLNKVERKNRAGWIYVFTDRGMMFPVIKIGHTNNLTQRLSAHRTASPFGLIILITFRVPDRIYAETFLHRRYHPARVSMSNEWFYSLPNILCDIFWLTFFAPLFVKKK